jgi:hypothetical protein
MEASASSSTVHKRKLLCKRATALRAQTLPARAKEAAPAW